jgi:arylsulfatase A-like enzyme
MKNRFRYVTLSCGVGLAFGICIGLAESLYLLITGNRYGQSVTFVLLGMWLYASVWFLVGLAMGVFLWILSLFSRKISESTTPALVAASLFIVLTLFAFGWGYMNTQVLATDFSTLLSWKSLLVDLLILLIAIAIAFLVHRLVRRWRGLYAHSTRLLIGISVLLILLMVASVVVGQLIDVARTPKQVTTAVRPVDPDRPNILFLLIDCLRKDHMSVYGYERDTTPTLDNLARQGVLFTEAIAPSSHTKTSTPSILTGLYPHHHHVLQIGQALSPGLLLIPEVLREHGYRTCMLSANPIVSPQFGFDQGADLYYSPRGSIRQSLFVGHIIHFLNRSGSPLKKKPGFSQLLKVLHVVSSGIERRLYGPSGGLSDYRAEGLHRMLLSFLSRGSDRPYFAYVHYMEPHKPYHPPGEYGTLYDPHRTTDRVHRYPEIFRGKVLPFDVGPELPPEDLYNLVAQYDGEIRYCDDQIGHLLKQLLESGHLENTLIVVTADHGEEFYDHQGWGHGQSVFQELINVPLFFWWKDHIMAPTTVDQYVSLVDLAPTLHEAAAIDASPATDGRSLIRWVDQGDDLVVDVSEGGRVISEFDWGGRSSAALIDGRWKYITAQKGSQQEEMLFDLVADPEEMVDLSDRHPEQVAALREALDLFRSSAPERSAADAVPIKVDEATRERLKALGYVE